MQTPDEIYKELFVAVQMHQVFPDSKTFVDCVPLAAPAEILEAYRRERDAAGFDLRVFVLKYFVPPAAPHTEFRSDASRSLEAHIRILWKTLERQADQPVEGSSLIPLPHRYVVPGGRFGEIYYWDSYFTILGLLESGVVDLAKSMLDNFAYLIDAVGHIPNGNRTYFLSRSQPPFFALMVQAVAMHSGDDSLYQRYLPQVSREYAFWMHRTGDDQAERRTVRIQETLLNRYWDDRATPRQESYREDVELAERSDRPAEAVWRNLRAACESGWDFSGRWCRDPMQLDSIMTTEILPVDLNCLIWSMEYYLCRTYEALEAHDQADAFKTACLLRQEAINTLMWDAHDQVYRDYHFIEMEQTDVTSLAMCFPLFIGIATTGQAAGVAEAIRGFLKSGGLVSTQLHTGQQWDAPNGWAPLQWIAYAGLRRYGWNDLAEEIAIRWIANVERVYQQEIKLVEKYDVEDMSLEAGGGEYPVQDGFGWTNGVVLKFLKRSLPTSPSQQGQGQPS